MLPENNPHPLHTVTSDFYAGFRQATIDYERKYQRQPVPIDEIQLAMMCIRVSAEENQSDLWKAGYHAGFFAAFYGVLYRWTVSCDWTLGELASVQYRIDYIPRVAV